MRIVANRNSLIANVVERQLQSIAPDIAITWILPDLTFSGPTTDAEILFRFEMPNDQLETCLRAMPQLKWMHTVSAGVDRFFSMFQQIAPPDAVMTNGSGSMSRPIAEYVLGQIIATSKNFPTFQSAQQQRTWLHDIPGDVVVRELTDLHILIFGYGSIGHEIAKLATAVGIHTTAVQRSPVGNGETGTSVEHLLSSEDPWQDLLPAMQYVIISAPLTPATHHLFDTELLGKMHQSAWLINIARGGIVDEPALAAAVQQGRLGGAVLDVTETEPLPADSALWNVPNIIITPHISWRSPQVLVRGWQLFFENVQRYRRGESLLNLVPRATGY